MISLVRPVLQGVLPSLKVCVVSVQLGDRVTPAHPRAQPSEYIQRGGEGTGLGVEVGEEG